MNIKNNKTIVLIVAAVFIVGILIGIGMNKDKFLNITTTSGSNSNNNIPNDDISKNNSTTNNTSNDNVNNNNDGQNNPSVTTPVNKKIKIDQTEFSLEIPESWNKTYKFETETDKIGERIVGKKYILTNMVKNLAGQTINSLIIAVGTSFENDQRIILGNYEDKRVTLYYSFRSVDGEDTVQMKEHAREVEEIIKTIKVKDSKNYDYLTITTEELQFRVPKSWQNQNGHLDYVSSMDEVLGVIVDKNTKGEFYKFVLNDKGVYTSNAKDYQNAFYIMVTDSNTYNESSWKYLGKYKNKNILALHTSLCRELNCTDKGYALENEVYDVLNSITLFK